MNFSYSIRMMTDFRLRFSHEKASYFDLGPLDLGENARRDMVLTLEDMGFEIEASHHEMCTGTA